MVTNLLTFLENISYKAYEIVVLPGNTVVWQLTTHTPGLALKLGIDPDNPGILPVAISIAVWLMCVILFFLLRRILRDLVRIVGAIIRTIYFRLSIATGNLKTKLVRRPREMLPRRNSSGTHEDPMIEFDNLDLAVLRSASAQGPGFALSAPDLAERFRLRPAQIQRSLKKLSKNKMLDYGIGSTDGYDNYRLTDSGAAFVAMWQRQNAGA